MDDVLAHYLERHKVHFTLHRHPAVFTVAESLAEPSVQAIPGLRCKTLFLRDEHKNYYLVGMPGVKRLDFKKLRQELELTELTMGSPEELLRETGLIPGSVSILGTFSRPGIVLIIDREVWDAPSVCFHPNINTETLVLPHNSLAAYYASIPNRKRIVTL